MIIWLWTPLPKSLKVQIQMVLQRWVLQNFERPDYFSFIQVLAENQEREPPSCSSGGRRTAVAISKSIWLNKINKIKVIACSGHRPEWLWAGGQRSSLQAVMQERRIPHPGTPPSSTGTSKVGGWPVGGFYGFISDFLHSLLNYIGQNADIQPQPNCQGLQN